MKTRKFLKIFISAVLVLCCEFSVLTSLPPSLKILSAAFAETSNLNLNVSEKLSFSDELNRLIDENYNLVLKNGYAELVVPQKLHGINENSFSPNCITAAKTLIKAGHKAYVIGGAVRDIIMGKPSNDFDIVTSASYDDVKALLPNVDFHTIQSGVEYACARYPGEAIDVAAFINIPSAYHGHDGIPDFDPSKLYGQDILSDSFQRDLTFNALYYDVETGDIIDFHGGLHDIREGVIDTIADAHLEFSYKPQNAFRALRFKSRYSYKLSPRVDEAIRKYIDEYVSKMQGTTLSNEITKMEFNGYSLTCWRALSEYGAVPYVFPPLSEIYETSAYRDYIEAALSSLDDKYKTNKDDKGYKRFFIAAALWPAIEREMQNRTSFRKSLSKILDEEGEVYVYWKNERRELQEFLYVENYLTNPQRLQPASALVSNPYFAAAFELLKVRAKFTPSLDWAVSFWTRQIPYDKDVLKSLKNTDNFQRGAIEHIFIGEVSRGSASGYHYARIKGARGYILPDTKEYLNNYGLYRAKIAVDGMPKSNNHGYSTFFPDAMSPQDVIDAINEAYVKRTKVPETENSFIGFTKNGMRIIMYIDSDEKIISAFPMGRR